MLENLWAAPASGGFNPAAGRIARVKRLEFTLVYPQRKRFRVCHVFQARRPKPPARRGCNTTKTNATASRQRIRNTCFRKVPTTKHTNYTKNPRQSSFRMFRIAIEKLKPTCWSQRTKPAGCQPAAQPFFPSEVSEKACIAICESFVFLRKLFPFASAKSFLLGNQETRSFAKKIVVSWFPYYFLVAAAPRCVFRGLKLFFC